MESAVVTHKTNTGHMVAGPVLAVSSAQSLCIEQKWLRVCSPSACRPLGHLQQAKAQLATPGATTHCLALLPQGAIPKGMDILAELKPGYDKILTRWGSQPAPAVAAG